MITPEQKQKLLGFLADHPVSVLATADPTATPAAAVVLFAAEDDLGIIFATHPTRKYRNLKANPQAAMAMTRDLTAIQIHGSAVELIGRESEAAEALFLKKHPEMDKRLVQGSVFFRLRPNWVRYIDIRPQPWEQWEVQL